MQGLGSARIILAGVMVFYRDHCRGPLAESESDVSLAVPTHYDYHFPRAIQKLTSVLNVEIRGP